MGGRGSRPSQTPLLSAVDATNSNLNLPTPALSVEPPPYGEEVDSIEFYQVLLEQYNELVEGRMQEVGSGLKNKCDKVSGQRRQTHYTTLHDMLA